MRAPEGAMRWVAMVWWVSASPAAGEPASAEALRNELAGLDEGQAACVAAAAAAAGVPGSAWGEGGLDGGPPEVRVAVLRALSGCRAFGSVVRSGFSVEGIVLSARTVRCMDRALEARLDELTAGMLNPDLDAEVGVADAWSALVTGCMSGRELRAMMRAGGG